MQIPNKLITKYNVPVPRYTSFPTLPFWDNNPMNKQDWFKSVKRQFVKSNYNDGISLYIHLPYCESLCTYCACNTRITKNHKVEKDYLDAVLAEWEMYRSQFESVPIIRELHLGGGTPTFFSPENLQYLVKGILSNSERHEDYQFSFEGHPNNTTYDHLATLSQLGFKRVSYGVQDLNLKVQTTINRVQPLENVIRATENARVLGYESVNFDLIYGLPFQTEESITKTIEEVISLRPERIAFYSYAHVPWKRPGQRGYTESNLPDDGAKRNLYETGKEILTDNGYLDIGMDHFAIKGDALYTAYQSKTLHRNFMGYTTNPGRLLLGLGVSAISDAYYAYAQNNKNVEEYIAMMNTSKPAHIKGHMLEDQDLLVRQIILDIACKGEVIWTDHQELLNLDTIIELTRMHQEELVQLFSKGLRVTDLGMAFLRNICAVFDNYLNDQNSEFNKFSKAI